MSKLFSPVQVGKCQLQHRVAMAPMTRRRGLNGFVPSELMIKYYEQRAAVPGTLLISEATSVSPRSAALPNTTGLFTTEQVKSWKEVTDAVHEKGSFIFVQLWATGRAARPGAIKLGAEVFSASDIPFSPESAIPRPLCEEEILELIKDFQQASINAIEAGFDGVEIHGANGYLVDQFTQDVSNKRTDRWGGNIENRSRFGIEIAKAISDAIGADRVGYRVSPWSRHHGMRMEDPATQFTYLIKELGKLKLAYLHVIESRVIGNADIEASESIDLFVDAWDNVSPVIVAGGYSGVSAQQLLDDKYQDKDVLVAFGRSFISNPDLPFRIQKSLPIEKYNRDLFYKVLCPEGYVDYKTSLEFQQQKEL